MSTPHSSVRLRRAVDAVAGERHETAFRILDLLLATPPDARRARADLLGDLAQVRAELEAHDGD